MFTMHLILLILIGFVGILFNWLLILAIQRKTYHHQEVDSLSTPVTNMTLLRPHASISTQIVRPPLLPSMRSSISTFDKYILAFLVNDILTCNILLPLRFIEISQGLPCIFLCFLLKFLEKLTTITELVIITLLIITSLIFFTKKRLVTRQLLLIGLLAMTPLIIIYLATALTHFDIDEFAWDRTLPSCKQIFIYMTVTTQKTLNILCCLITYSLLCLHLILLMKMKWAIKTYTLNSLKTMTEAATLTRTIQQDVSLFEQVNRT
jgi:hypothetical protein